MKIQLKRTDNLNELSLDTECTTGAELRAAIANTYDFNPSVIIVHSGKIIEDSDAIKPSMDGGTVILAKWRHPSETFQIMQYIASKNPLFLSYLAVSPLKATEILDAEAAKPDFPFKTVAKVILRN
jgi:hypothetical protein